MRLEMAVEPKAVPFGQSKQQRLVENFLEKGWPYAEVINEGDYDSYKAMKISIKRSVKAHYEGRVEVVNTGDKLFLKRLEPVGIA